MKEMDSKVTQAFEFAYKKHKGMKRKTSGVPYIVHPMSVAIILMKNNASNNIVAAGLLHDVIEDTDVAFSEIRKIFGRKVTELVRAVTEPKELRKPDSDPKGTWKQRKQHTIDILLKAEKDVKLLSCADKLSNIKDLIAEYNLLGEKLWDKFNAPRKKQHWYYRSLCNVFASGLENIVDLPVFHEFKVCVEQLFKEES
ncbi:MAG: HD domain-containing protein [Candidatus Hodarchaeales archaeon]|jgi:(p)ppGpp synthase/HD superfamily hydrolase